MVARFQYALPAIGEFLTADDISSINAVFVKARKWGLTTTVPIASHLIQIADNKLLEAALDVKHCLHSLLPPVLDSFRRNLRKRSHSFLMPLARTNLHKESFIARCFL